MLTQYDSKFQKAARLAPQKNTAKTPVIATTGDDDGTGRKRITRQDIISLKEKFDKLRVPTQGRRLVLCSDHVNDLLMVDQKFADQYYNYTTGKIANMYGFAVYEFANNPYYSTAGVKCALKSTTVIRPRSPSTPRECSKLPVRRRCIGVRRKPTPSTSATR